MNGVVERELGRKAIGNVAALTHGLVRTENRTARPGLACVLSIQSSLDPNASSKRINSLGEDGSSIGSGNLLTQNIRKKIRLFHRQDAPPHFPKVQVITLLRHHPARKVEDHRSTTG